MTGDPFLAAGDQRAAQVAQACIHIEFNGLIQAGGEQRTEAFLALGKLRDPRAEAVLIRGLNDDDWQVRMNAAMALGPLGGPQAAAALRRTLDDEVHVVREWSARSLEMVTGQPVLYRNAKNEMVRPYNVYH